MKFRMFCAILFLGVFLNVTAQAGSIDWSTVTLSGSFPNFSFFDADLGNVNLAYPTTASTSGSPANLLNQL